ncbi:hypothetical protein [Turicibacter sanguinis]|uniref:hypothetical protein n=1 Tax=Turicibacter sanguinis TaxID=154288 RepID=UPI00399B2525
MELRYTTSFSDFIDAGLLVSWRRPIQYFLEIIFSRICMPLFIILYTIYLITQNHNFGAFLFFSCLFVLQSLDSLLLQKFFRTRRLKRELSKLLLVKPYLLEEKQLIPRNKSVCILYSSNHKIDRDVKYVLRGNNKLYLYAEKYRSIEIIPESIFSSNKEKQLFLKMLDIPVETVTDHFLYWGLW